MTISFLIIEIERPVLCHFKALDLLYPGIIKLSGICAKFQNPHGPCTGVKKTLLMTLGFYLFYDSCTVMGLIMPHSAIHKSNENLANDIRISSILQLFYSNEATHTKVK